MHAQRKVILFLGPPGSGKGTQATRLSAALGVPAISTGEMLRRECRSGSSLGKAVQSVLVTGQLVSDELINQVVGTRLSQRDCEQGCILDGYPRTVSQARFLDRLLGTLSLGGPVVFDFKVDTEQVIARLGRRRQCPECGHVFTVDPGSQGRDLVCERDGARLVLRSDDNPATIRARLNLYEEHAGELVRYYSARAYHRISASRTPEEVSAELLRNLEHPTERTIVNRPQVPVQARYRAQSV